MATRRERVLLELEDNFSSGMVKAAAATKLLDKELNSLSGRAVKSRKDIEGIGDETESLGRKADGSGKQIDKLSGRLALMAKAASVLGPALIPIGAIAAPAIAGMAASTAALAIAGGSAVVAFKGVGEAIKAVQEAKLDPTVANLAKADEALRKIAPAAREFVAAFQDFRPVLTEIRDAAARGWFPGLIDSLDDFERLAPKVITLFEAVGTAGGNAVADAAESLAGDRWSEFFDFLAVEAPAAVTSLAATIGDLTHGVAELWMSFDPGNDSFLSFVGNVADGFDRWASSASGRQDIESFLAYVQETGPDVADAFGSLVNMLVQVTQAAAPIGGPVLNAISAVADVIAAIADSNLGTPIFTTIAAMSALSAVTTAWGNASTTSAGKAVSALVLTKNAAGATTLSMSGLAAAAGLATVAIVGLDTGGQIVNSFNRSREAVNGTSDSFEELKSKLEKSNVGKYADEFGINIDRLATDIGKFGDKGEYYAEVTARMDAANDGFGGRVKELGNFLTPMIGQTEKASLATLDLEGVTRNAAGGLGQFASAAVGAVAATANRAQEASRAAAAVSKDTAAIQANITAMQEQRNAALGALNAQIGYEAAIDGAQAALKANGRTLDITTEKGRANKTALLSMAAAWNQQSDAAKNAPGAHRAAIRSFVNMATQMGMARGQAERLARRILEIPSKRVTISADASQALREIARVNYARIANKSFTITTFYDAVRRDSNTANFAPPPAPTVRRAAGGAVYGPGSATSDSIPARLSNGEYVVQAAAVQKYGVGMFDKLNSMGFASGGSVDDRIGILKLQKKVEEIRQDLRGTGKDRQSPIERRISELELQKAQLELRTAMNGGAGVSGHKKPANLADVFDLEAGMSVKGVVREFDQLQKAMGRIGPVFVGMEKAAIGVAKRYNEHEKQLASLNAKAKDLRSAASGAFNTDVFGNGAGDLMKGLQGDISSGGQMIDSLRTLRHKGISSALAAGLSSSGDFGTAQELAKMSRGQIDKFDQAFRYRQQIQQGVGQAAVETSYGPQIRQQTRVMARLAKKIEGLERSVERGARAGTRAGNDDKARAASGRRRTSR